MYVDPKRIEAAKKLHGKCMSAHQVAARCLMDERDVREVWRELEEQGSETSPTQVRTASASSSTGQCACGAPTYDGKEWCWRHEMNPHRRPVKPDAAPATAKCRGCERKAEIEGWCPSCRQKIAAINSRQGKDTIRAARESVRRQYW